MTILCGTDFSEPAQRALRVAVQLARRQNKPLQLLHAIQLSQEELTTTPPSEVVTWAERQLVAKADFVRANGVAVTTHLKAGAPDDMLIAHATQCQAELIVLGALGHRAKGDWQLGSHADRLAQRAHVPVLVVRAAEPFEVWLEGKRPLQIVLGADLSHSTDVAMAKVRQFRKLAPGEVTAVHLYWPPEQFRRLGLDGVRSYLEPDPEVTKTLVRDLTHRLAGPDGAESMLVYAEPHLGRLGDRLAAIAKQRGADLLVVGAHDRSALGRIWEGSVARWALHASETSVLVVPRGPEREPQTVAVPRLRNVFVATDFSPTGNAAIGLAYAVADPGATVHVAHVVPSRAPQSIAPHDVFALEQTAVKDPRSVEIHVALSALVPRDAERITRVYALESNDAAAAICQAARRVDADVICLGHRGRSTLANAILGSVASEVLARAELPVLFSQTPGE